MIDPSGKILRHPGVLMRMRNGERIWPLNVEMDLSNRCNAKCRHCSFAHLHDGSLLPTALACHILADLAEGGMQAVTLSGGGEPTTHPDFAVIAHAASAYGLAVGVYSNGLSAIPLVGAMDALAWVYVSLDALDDADYRQIKRVSGFWQVVDTIGHLVTLRQGSVPTVGVGFLLNSGNWRDAAGMAALADGLGADYAHFRPIVGLPDYAWVTDALPTLDALVSDSVYVSHGRFVELRDGTPRGYTVCRASELVPCIGATGTVWVCPNTRGLRRLGNLHEESFAAIWARRPEQVVGLDCRVACRNHALNGTLEYVCGGGPHDAFV